MSVKKCLHVSGVMIFVCFCFVSVSVVSDLFSNEKACFSRNLTVFTQKARPSFTTSSVFFMIC